MRTISFPLFLLALFSLSPGASAQVEVRTDGLDLQSGRSFVLPVEVSDLSGLEVTSFEFALRYDADLIEVERVEAGGTLSQGLSVTANASGRGVVRVAAAGATALSGSGTLVRLVGRVRGENAVGEAVTTPTFVGLAVFDAGGDEVPTQADVGPIRVAGLRVRLPAVPGGTGPFSVPVEVDDLTGQDVTAYQFSLRYDPSVLRIDAATTAGTITSGGATVVNAGTPGRLVVAHAGTAPLEGGGPLVVLEGARLSGGDPGLEFQELLVFDEEGAEVVVTGPEFQVRPPAVGGSPGNTVSVPIRTGALDGRGVTAYQFTVRYDPAVVEVLGVETEGTVSAGLGPVFNAGTPGEASVALASASPLVGGGELVRLRVRRLRNGDPGMAFVSYRLFGSDETQVPLTISPQRGGDVGSVTATITGVPFTEGVNVRLVRGGTVIEGDVVGGEDEVLRAVFNLFGQPRGSYDLEVTSSGVTGRLEEAFEVVEGQEYNVWVDVVGRSTVRTGRPQPYTVFYGNRGNTDVVMMPVNVAIPQGLEWTLDAELIDIPELTGLPHYVDLSIFSDSVAVDTLGFNIIPLFIPLVPAGQSGSFTITITPTTDNQFAIRAWTSSPLFEEYADGTVKMISDVGGGVFDPTSCALATFGGTLVAAGGLAGNSLSRCLAGLAGTYGGMAQAGVSVARSSDGLDVAISATSFWTAGMTQLVSIPACAQTVIRAVPFLRGLSIAATVVGGVLVAIDVYRGCDVPDQVTSLFEAIGSFDPNEKVGSSGAGDNNYLSGEEPLRYAIYFENLPSASAAAQEVFVTDTLDTSVLDLSTFSFGPIFWGTEGRVNPPAGLQRYATRVDLRPEMDLLLGIDATLNRATGVARWTFRSLDPDTGILTDDPFAGFLPPNTNPPEGEGRVLFTVEPRPTLTTGTPIRNQARIVFDVNEPIDTNTWLNTIDNSAPTSRVEPFEDGPTPVDSVLVTWSGEDAGAGVANYSVYVSVNGAPAQRWLANTQETSAYYVTGTAGTLGFYSVARDATGNTERPPDAPDAVVTIAVPGEGGPEAIPLYLAEVAPNPVGEAASIRYGLPSLGEVSIEVYDMLGRRVSRLIDERRDGGHHSVQWEPDSLASGAYVLVLRHGGRRVTRTFVVRR